MPCVLYAHTYNYYYYYCYYYVYRYALTRMNTYTQLGTYVSLPHVQSTFDWTAFL